MNYRLQAEGMQGARIEVLANTMSECVDIFDFQYERSGFRIVIIDNLNGGVVRIVKRGFR